MATTKPSAAIELSVTITFTEAEVRALDALVGYGTDAFLKVFYANLGEAYMKPHEAGLRALFASVRPECQAAISRINAARKAFNGDESK